MKSTRMKKPLGMLALGAMALIATGAQADWARGGDAHQHAYQQTQAYRLQINARQEQQRERIMAGMRTGSLTRAEFRDLMHEQREIRAMEHRFRADGVIGAREFRRLDDALDVASRNIRMEKHDRQARNAYAHPPRYN